MKHSKPYTFILQTVNKPPDVFFTHIFFDSKIILIFSGIFLLRLSRLLIVNLKWIKVPTVDFSKTKSETQERTQNQLNPVGSEERSLPEATPGTDYFSKYKISKGSI